MHPVPAAHGASQRPQWTALLWVSSHIAGVPHRAWPVGHAQRPAEHTWPIGQAIPHAPQLARSLWVSTHNAGVPQRA